MKGNSAFTEYKGALTEQFVLQELVQSGLVPFYWTSRSGAAEVDFLLQGPTDIVPIEVKAGINLQAKSLKTYIQQYAPRLSLRLSLRPYHPEASLTNVPLYAAGMLNTIIGNLLDE